MTKPASGIPLEVKFQQRAKGVLQNRAAWLQEQLTPESGGDLVAEIARIGRHTGQLVLEIQDAGVPLVRSYKSAVPVFGKSSELAREISANMGLGGDIDPSHTTSLHRLN